MPILWPLKAPERGNNAITKKSIGNWTLVFVYSSYHLNISFPSSGRHFNKLERVLETPKNGFVSTVTLWITLNKTNSGKNKTNDFTTQIKLPKKILAKFSYPKKSRNRKFQTQKNPPIIPVIWNPEYPPWGVDRRSKLSVGPSFSPGIVGGPAERIFKLGGGEEGANANA